MRIRSLSRSAIVTSALALIAGCHGHHSATGGSISATSTYSAAMQDAVGAFAPAGAKNLVEVAGLGDDFAIEPGAAFVEEQSGRAFLTAVLARRSAPDERLAVRIEFGDALMPDHPGYDQAASPRLELAPEAYRAAGGPVDEKTWHYYDVVNGELRGIGALAGIEIHLAAADASGLQCGLGADNLDVVPGASVRLAGAAVSELGSGVQTITLAFALRSSERTYAVTSPGDAVLGGVPRPALSIPALGGDFDVVAGGSFVERADGTVRFDAVVADSDAGDRRFALTLLGRDRRDAIAGSAIPGGSPRLELSPTAYRDAGGPVDAGTWRHYAAFDGVLYGLESLAGAEVAIHGGAFALQAGYGASGVDGEFGASADLSLLVVSQPLAGPQLVWGATDGTLRATLRRAHVATADEPVRDADFGDVGGYALRVPGLAEDFVVVAGGEFCERADGAAELFAELASVADPDEQWTISLWFGDRVDSDDAGGLPPGSPALRLAPGAYAANGGPIDPTEWHYYAQLSGELRGIGPRAGARIALASANPAVQVGEGANGSNLRFGLSAGLVAQLVTQPSGGAVLSETFGPAEILLTLERLGDRCATAAARDVSVSVLPGDSAFRLPGMGEDFVLLPGARLAERADGTAELRGIAARASNSSQRFLVNLAFVGRVDRGVPPPAGSPELELATSAYVGAGGTVDPSTWHYYLATEGSLVGLGAWHGASVRLTRSGPAFQVGNGASGKNKRYGASGSVVVEVVSQPGAGAALVPAGTGELNLALFDACP